MTKQRLNAYILLLVTSIIWGVAAPIIKYTLGDFPPLIFLTYRFALSAVIGLAYILVKKPVLFKNSSEAFHIFIYGFLTTTIGLGFLFLGLEYTTSMSGTVVMALHPTLVALAGVWFLRERITHTERLGSTIALIGTLGIIVEPFLTGPHSAPVFASFQGNLFILLSLFFGVVTAIQSKILLRKNVDPIALTHVTFIVGFITILIPTFFVYAPSEIMHAMTHASLISHLGVWFMALISGTLGYILWHKGQKAVEVGEAAIFSYLNPIWAAPLAVLWLNEAITPPFIIGSIVIAIGVGIAEVKRRHATKTFKITSSNVLRRKNIRR